MNSSNYKCCICMSYLNVPGRARATGTKYGSEFTYFQLQKTLVSLHVSESYKV